MTMKTVEFSYTVGSARFNLEADVDEESWNEADKDGRLDLLRDAAMDDIDGMLEIEEASINDNVEDES